MREIFFLGILFLNILFFVSNYCYSSPWGQKENELFIATQFYTYSAKKYWNNSGNKKDIGCTYRKNESAIYGEYGYSNKTTITLRIPYIDSKCGENTAYGISDIELSMIRKLKEQDKSIISAQCLLLMPTGYSIDKPVRIGYNRIGTEFDLIGGYSIKNTIFEGGTGFRYYAGYPSEQIRAYARIGYIFGNILLIMDTLDLQYGLMTGKKKTIGFGVTVEPNYKLLQNDLFFGFKLNEQITFGFGWIKALWGRNVGEDGNIYVQLWFKF